MSSLASTVATTLASSLVASYFKTKLVYGGASFAHNKSDNIPEWIFYVNSAALLLCLLTCILWLCCAMCAIAKPKECNHKVIEARVIVEKKAKEEEDEPAKVKNSQRSSKRAVGEERNEGGKCVIQMN